MWGAFGLVGQRFLLPSLVIARNTVKAATSWQLSSCSSTLQATPPLEVDIHMSDASSERRRSVPASFYRRPLSNPPCIAFRYVGQLPFYG